MNNLLTLQKQFIDLRFGCFIHFNSGTVQFHSGDIEDWEYSHENNHAPRLYPFREAD